MRTKKLWNQIVSILLVIALLPVSALAELRPEDTAHPDVVNQPEFTVSVSHVNPEYERLGVRFPRATADCMTMAETTVDTLEEAAEYLRGQMEDRVTQVTISVGNYTFVDGTQMQADWKTILYGALAHTGVSTQGDYIVRHYGKSEGQIGYDGISTATFVYNIVYDTTLEQENTVGERIDELFTAWDAECGFYDLSDYEQVKVIYDYICENVVYDYKNLWDPTYTLKYSAYAALINGTAVCQGYANLFYRMALEAGIDTRIIVGDGGGPHSWNIVDLGEMYYYLDATWDAPLAEKDYPYEYFLLGSDNFCVDHTPEADNVLDCDVTTYPIDTADYVPTVEQDTLIEEATEAGLLRYFDTVTMDTELTRLAAAKLIVALAELELDTTATLPFADCADLTEEEQQIITTVCQAGLMTGYDATTFQPANTLTRAMVALILYRAMNGGVDDEDIWDYADDGLFSDIGNSKWYTPYVNYLASIGVIPTSTDGKFYPNDTAILRPVLRWAVNATNLASEEPELPEIPEDIIASGECGKDGDNLTWTLTEDGTLTISGEGAIGNYGYKTTPWYTYREQITAVVIENGTTNISSYAFYGCSSLTNITLPNSVTTIGNYAFIFCLSLTSMEIPDSVTSIGHGAFSHCYCLTNIIVNNQNDNFSSMDGILFDKKQTQLITYPAGKQQAKYKIPDSITSIGNRAFAGCQNLTSVEIPDCVTSIGAEVFIDCHNLTSIVIPNSITSIGNKAFYSCNSLTVVYYGGTEEQWSNIVIGSENDPLLNATIIYEWSGELDEPDIPEDVIASGECGENLTWVLTEDGTLTISGEGEMDDYAWGSSPLYNYSDSILAVVVEDGVTSIGNSTFYYCESLTSIVIPDSITSIGDYAFYRCKSLTSIVIPDSVTNIGNYVFFCAGLQSFIVDSANAYYCSEDGVLFDKNKTTLLNYPVGNTRTTYTIPSSVTNIGDLAFRNAQYLASIVLPDGLISIGDEVFAYCSSLETIEIPNSVENIGERMFEYCKHLHSITIGSANNFFTSEDGVLFNKDKTTLLYYPVGSTQTAYTVPDSVTIVGRYAFAGARNLVNVTLSDGVTSIDNWAFRFCSNFTSITIPTSVTTIGDFAFEDCHNLADVQIPSSVTYIGAHSFEGTDVLENIVVGTYLAQATGTGNEFIVYGLPFSVTISNETFTTGEFWLVSCQNGAIYPYDYAKPTTIVGRQTKIWWNAAKHTINGVDYKDSINYVLDDAGYDKEHAYTWFFDADGYVIGSSSNLFAHTHIEEVIPGYSATCTENGLTDGLWCGECGEILLAQEVIPAMGHIDDNSDDLCDRCSKNLCTPKIVFASQSVTSGQTITVEITAVNMPAVKALMLENFQYDSDMLEFVDAELNLGDAVIADWDSTDMIATVAFDENTDINGTILTLTFKVKEGVEGECSITCDVYVNQMQADGNETQVALSVVSSTIVVISYQRGDVNGDGYVNSNDSIYLLRYILTPNRYPINQSGDMNGDGYVNSNDAIYLLRHILTPSRYPLA